MKKRTDSRETTDWGTRIVTPAGLVVRRLRHERGWPMRELVESIGEASLRSGGVRETISPNMLAAIEERNERIPYETLCLLAAGLDCDPIDLLAQDGVMGGVLRRREAGRTPPE